MPFYIYKNNEQTGPHDDAAVEEGLRTGKFSPLDLASRDGATGWESLSTFFPFISLSRSSSSSSQPPPASQASSQQPPPSSSPPPYAWAQDSQSTPGANQPYQSQPFGTQQQPSALAGQTYQPPLVAQPMNQFSGAPSSSKSPLPMTGMVLGIVTMCLMLIGLVPCLGWVNWLMLSIGTIAVIVAFMGVVMEKNDKARNKAIIGLSLSLIAVFIGTIRLAISLGIGGGGCV